MTKPKFILPLKVNEGGGRTIRDSSECSWKPRGNSYGYIITFEEQDFRNIEDMEYIVEACNNYPKAVEILRCVLRESSMENEFDKDIEEFLLSIGTIEKISNDDTE